VPHPRRQKSINTWILGFYKLHIVLVTQNKIIQSPICGYELLSVIASIVIAIEIKQPIILNIDTLLHYNINNNIQNKGTPKLTIKIKSKEPDNCGDSVYPAPCYNSFCTFLYHTHTYLNTDLSHCSCCLIFKTSCNSFYHCFLATLSTTAFLQLFLPLLSCNSFYHCFLVTLSTTAFLQLFLPLLSCNSFYHRFLATLSTTAFL
jgi:hypothetical protein